MTYFHKTNLKVVASEITSSFKLDLTSISMNDVIRICIGKEPVILSKIDELDIKDYCHVVFDDNSIIYNLNDLGDFDNIFASEVIEIDNVLYDIVLYDSWYYKNILLIKDACEMIDIDMSISFISRVFEYNVADIYSFICSDEPYHNFFMCKLKEQDKYYIAIISFPENEDEIKIWKGTKFMGQEGYEDEFLSTESVDIGIKCYIYMQTSATDSYKLTYGKLDKEISEIKKLWCKKDQEYENIVLEYAKKYNQI